MTQTRHVSTTTAVLFGVMACMLYGTGAGLRGNIGILLNPLADSTGLTYSQVSICIAVLQLLFGVCQPFLGMLATRTSNRFVLNLAVVFFLLSLLGMSVANSFPMLMLSLGIFMGIGTGAIAFGLVLTSAMRFVGEDRAMLISGMLNAAAGLCGFVLAPAMQSLLSSVGLVPTLYWLCLLIALLIPFVLLVTSRDKASVAASGNANNRKAMPLRQAFKNRTYFYLMGGFWTCGFHMVIIESHLFNEYVGDGIEANAASWAFSIYAVATIVGALLSGWLSSVMDKGLLLGFYYAFRAVWVLAFLFVMPHNLLFAVIFSIGLGMTGDATVSPTAGLLNSQFKLKDVATLMGFLFLGHQVGGFLSAWLGGVLLETTGGYTAVWLIDVVLCITASISSYRIISDRRRNRAVVA